jgi:hypothetical protein
MRKKIAARALPTHEAIASQNPSPYFLDREDELGFD